jgi:predicted transcriptional regulator
MRSDAPRLLPVLRSQHQADLLTMLLLHPAQEFTISELARRLSVPQSTVSGEARRLADAGILADRAVGRAPSGGQRMWATCHGLRLLIRSSMRTKSGTFRLSL